MAGTELRSPTEMPLLSPSEEKSVPSVLPAEKTNGTVEKVRMKKELGLLEGVAIILGIILGSGIFISPKGVIKEVGSVGLSIVIWILCGLLSMIGALCYAELGTSIPKSGGDYAYIYEAFGPLPAFLYLWDANLIFVPTTNAIMALTFSSYVVQPFFPNCEVPALGVNLLAAATISILSYINSVDVKSTTKLQNIFMFCKIGALTIIIVAGIIYVGFGNTQNFNNAFEGSVTSPGKIAISFYSGIFSYSGWNYLNFMTEELKDPYKNLPRAIFISLPLVTFIYVLANVAYLAVLTPSEMLASNAIAVTFGDRLLGVMSWVMPVMVAISALGGLSVHIMTSSRMLFVGARNGHFPIMLSHINVDHFTPTPSLVFLNVLSLVMLCTSDIYVLITYCTIVESTFITLSVSAVLWLRYKQPNLARPIKVNLLVPIFFVLVCILLIVVPCYVAPYEVAVGVLITVTGVPAYYAGVCWQSKPKWFTSGLDECTRFCQKLFMSAREEQEDEAVIESKDK